MSTPSTPKHDVQIMSTGRHGSWAVCSCGWKSSTFTSAVGASVAFARHVAGDGSDQ